MSQKEQIKAQPCSNDEDIFGFPEDPQNVNGLYKYNLITLKFLERYNNRNNTQIAIRDLYILYRDLSLGKNFPGSEKGVEDISLETLAEISQHLNSMRIFANKHILFYNASIEELEKINSLFEIIHIRIFNTIERCMQRIN